MTILGIGLVALGWSLIVFGHVGDPVYGPVFNSVLHTGLFLTLIGVVRAGFAAVCREIAASRTGQAVSARPLQRGVPTRGRIEPTLSMGRSMPAPIRRQGRWDS